MNWYKILRVIIWALPLYLVYQTTYQGEVLVSMQKTFQEGEVISARVDDFRIKHIASQTNGYVVLDFTSGSGTHVNRRLSLPVQLAAPIQDMANINIRYREGASQEIVMIPTFKFHRNMVLVNIAVLLVSTLITFLIALWATKLSNRRIREPEEPNFVRVD